MSTHGSGIKLPVAVSPDPFPVINGKIELKVFPAQLEEEILTIIEEKSDAGALQSLYILTETTYWNVSIPLYDISIAAICDPFASKAKNHSELAKINMFKIDFKTNQILHLMQKYRFSYRLIPWKAVSY